MKKANQARVLKTVMRLNALLHSALFCLSFVPLFDVKTPLSKPTPSAFVGLSALLFFVLAIVLGCATFLVLSWKIGREKAHCWTLVSLLVAPIFALLVTSLIFVVAPHQVFRSIPLFYLAVPITYGATFAFCVFEAKL